MQSFDAFFAAQDLDICSLLCLKGSWHSWLFITSESVSWAFIFPFIFSITQHLVYLTCITFPNLTLFLWFLIYFLFLPQSTCSVKARMICILFTTDSPVPKKDNQEILLNEWIDKSALYSTYHILTTEQILAIFSCYYYRFTIIYTLGKRGGFLHSPPSLFTPDVGSIHFPDSEKRSDRSPVLISQNLSKTTIKDYLGRQIAHQQPADVP